MKSKSILFSVKKSIRKYNPYNNVFEWEHEFEYKISGISRIDDLVIVTTYSNWGKNFTSLLSFETGKKFWEIQNVFYSIHIIENTIIFLDKNIAICLGLASGLERLCESISLRGMLK